MWRNGPDPSVAEVMALLPEEGGSVPAADASRFRLFEGVTRLLRVAAGADGLIVVLDDLQWGDEASVRLLGFVGRSLSDEPVVIVGTYRDDEVGTDHPLAAVSAELAGRLRHLRLSGLDADELAAFVRSQRAGDGALASEQVAELHRVTGGNPFFAREALALVGGERSRASMRVPAGVRVVIERRLARLSHGCDDALKVAAVIGTSFALDVVADAMGSDVADVLGCAGRGARGRRCRGRRRRSRWHAVCSRPAAGDGLSVDPGHRSGRHSCPGRRGIGATTPGCGGVAGDGCPSPDGRGSAGRAGTGGWCRGARRRGGVGDARPRRGRARGSSARLSLMRSDDAGDPDAIARFLGLGEARLRGGDLPGARDCVRRGGEHRPLVWSLGRLGRGRPGAGCGSGWFRGQHVRSGPDRAVGGGAGRRRLGRLAAPCPAPGPSVGGVVVRVRGAPARSGHRGGGDGAVGWPTARRWATRWRPTAMPSRVRPTARRGGTLPPRWWSSACEPGSGASSCSDDACCSRRCSSSARSPRSTPRSERSAPLPTPSVSRCIGGTCRCGGGCGR